MIIRIQNKHSIITCQNVYYKLDEFGYSIQGGCYNGEIFYLGFYTSEERCLEILDSIEGYINYNNHYSHSGINSLDCQSYEYGIYQMPKV